MPFTVCLSPKDDYPLASLPLLGYSVTIPSESENIHKDYVFKLHFKSHIYYFRTESEYSFERYRGFSIWTHIFYVVAAVLWCHICQKIDESFCLPTGGWRSSAVLQSPPVALVCSTAKSPSLTELTGFHTPSPSGGISPFLPRPLLLDSWLFFSTHIWDICTCVHAHLVLFNALMVTCPLV